MKIYNYEITYIDGHVDKFEYLTERIDMEAITKKPWWLLDCGDWSVLIRTEQIARVREKIEELAEYDSLDLALRRTNYSKSKTMKMLGISERTLYRMMREHHWNTAVLKP